MPNKLEALFDKNRLWAAKVNAEDPEFFDKLSEQQKPDYLWIGCADSRVPANQIVDLLPEKCSSIETSLTLWSIPI